MAHSYIDYSDWERLSRDPLVSVAMPTYNHERYLRDAIEGVVAQTTDFPIELIIGEDTSTDGSLAIALEYWRAYPHLIRVLTAEHNVGMHENDARILNAARGRYLAFCEGDDCWNNPEKLRRQVTLLENDSKVALVCGSWMTISEDGRVLNADELRLRKNSVYHFGLDEILGGKVKTVTVCMRTQMAQRALRESPLCEPGLYPFGDAPLWVEANRQGTCLCLPDNCGSYRLSSNSVTRPRDIMKVYRFIADASGFDRTVLGLYNLRPGPGATLDARIRATRKRLRALAFLGEATQVGEEMNWLSRLGARASLGEQFLYWGASISRPGTWTGALRRWGLLKWQAWAHPSKNSHRMQSAAQVWDRAGSHGHAQKQPHASSRVACALRASPERSPDE